MSTFVLVHGICHGGWCWDEVAASLRSHGHQVFTPTMPGVAERRHEASRSITIDTHVDELLELFRNEGLQDVILVGHSMGGVAITGVADRIPQLLRHLVYLDSMIVWDGRSPLDQGRRAAVTLVKMVSCLTSRGLFLPSPSPKTFGVLDPETARRVKSQLTPQPMGVLTAPVTLTNPVANGVPRTYVTSTSPIFTSTHLTRAWVRDQGWEVRELATGHDAMITAPAETADLLLELALA